MKSHTTRAKSIFVTLLSVSVFSLFFGVAHVSPVLAQTQTTSPSAELREIIRQRLEQTLQTSPGSTLLGVVGSVTRVGTATFVLTDPTGREHTVVIDQNTTFAGNAQVNELSDLTIDSGVAVIGTSSDNVLLNARRVIPATKPFVETRRVALGTIETLERSSISVQERGNGQTTSAAITNTTRFEDILGNTVPRTSIQEDEAVLIIIDEATAGRPTAKRIRLLVAATAE